MQRTSRLHLSAGTYFSLIILRGLARIPRFFPIKNEHEPDITDRSIWQGESLPKRSNWPFFRDSYGIFIYKS